LKGTIEAASQGQGQDRFPNQEGEPEVYPTGTSGSLVLFECIVLTHVYHFATLRPVNF
jgi:hypothetical protein